MNISIFVFFFFFSSRRRHTRCLSDWSSDVCSSDLRHLVAVDEHRRALARGAHAAEVPGIGPELLRTLDRPAVEVRVAVQLEAALAHHLAGELRRSEERRVGEEWRDRWEQYLKK